VLAPNIDEGTRNRWLAELEQEKENDPDSVFEWFERYKSSGGRSWNELNLLRIAECLKGFERQVGKLPQPGPFSSIFRCIPDCKAIKSSPVSTT